LLGALLAAPDFTSILNSESGKDVMSAIAAAGLIPVAISFGNWVVKQIIRVWDGIR
jgi:hypothetical protein